MAATDFAMRARAAAVRGLMALPHSVLRRIVGRPVTLDGQQLDVEAQLMTRLLALAGEEPLARQTPEAARARVREDARAFEGPKVAVGRVEDTTVEGAAGPRRARLYVPPDGTGADADGALLVYFHGGGFVVGDLDTHDNPCRFLCRHAGVRVLAVDYRLAPEHRFPAAPEDALAAFRSVVANASQLGARPDRIGVAGDSAGGNLAAGVAHAARSDDPGPALQLLFYPWLDLSTKRGSYGLFGEGFYLTEEDLDWYRGHYLAADADALDPRCSPLLADDLAGTPPAYVVTAGFDPLRDEAEEHARRLRAAGTRVVLRRHTGLVHAFIHTSELGRSGRTAMLEAAGALRYALSA